MTIVEKHIRKHKEDRLNAERLRIAHEPYLRNVVNSKVGKSIMSAPFAKKHDRRPSRSPKGSRRGRSTSKSPRNSKSPRSRRQGLRKKSYSRSGSSRSSRSSGRRFSRPGSKGRRRPGGRRHYSRSSSPACSARGSPKTTPRGTNRKVCYQWKKTGKCTFGSQCKYLHSEPGRSDKDKKKALAAQQEGDVDKVKEEIWLKENTRGGDWDERDYAWTDDDDSSSTAAAFGKGKGRKGKGKGKGRRNSKGKGKGKGRKKMRPGKGYARRSPCKYWILGDCKAGKDCTFFHGEKARQANAALITAAAVSQSSQSDTKDHDTTSGAERTKVKDKNTAQNA